MAKHLLWIENQLDFHAKALIDCLANQEIEKIEITFVQTKSEWDIELEKAPGFFDLVILDLQLPIEGTEKRIETERRGVNLIKSIKNKWPNTPIVILSGYEKYRKECISLGADTFIVKPILPDEFMKIIFDLLGIKMEK